MREPKALTFDVFGTVVDWRTSIAREGRAFGERHGIETDWERFADDWRGALPAFARAGARRRTALDPPRRPASRESMHAARNGVEWSSGRGGVSDASVDEFNRAWHRLDPWPDAVEGLTRLKRRYVLATLSNGNVALLVNMAKRAGLPLGCGARRGGGAALQAAARCLSHHRGPGSGSPPGECMMVAPRTTTTSGRRGPSASVPPSCAGPPSTAGPGPGRSGPRDAFDIVADDFIDLAEALGA